MGVMLELNHLHNAITSRTPYDRVRVRASDSDTVLDNNNGTAPGKVPAPPVTVTATPNPVVRLTTGRALSKTSPSSTSSYFGVILTLVVTYLTREYFTALESPVIDTSHGKVQGFIARSRDGRKYYEYLGIPYASPPVGSLRFEPPSLPQPWNGIRKTTRFGSECVQLEIMVTGKTVGEEDCLYLNVYTPSVERNPNSQLPVMVYIHGGLFMSGSANMYRAKFFMDQDIVLVTFNYRLAALGFLNTGDEMVRGNMGLKDQNMALRWVQQNIAQFGGDPRRVTLFGESAGGAAVHYHILSPASKNLFQKALSQSGTALKPWALTKDPGEQARKLGDKFNCQTNSTSQLVHCLRSVPARKLVQVHLAAMTTLRDPLDTFVPTIEEVIRPDTFLAQDPNELVKAGKFNHVPWMTGVNAGEGLLNVGRLLSEKALVKRMDKDWYRLAPVMLSYDSRNFYASNEIKNYYFGNTLHLNPVQEVENFTKLFSDRNFFQGTHKAAIMHSKQAPVYLYYMTYSGRISLFNLFKWISPVAPIPVEVQVALEVVKDLFSKYVLGLWEPFYGPCHADELPLLFNMHMVAEIMQSARDYAMSRSLVKLWTDFAKDESHLKYKNTVWSPVNPNQTSTLKYLHINEYGGMVDEPFAHRLRFWDSLHL